MKKLSLSQQAIVLMGVLLFILIGFGVYYYQRVSDQEEYLHTRNLRYLTRLGNQINSRVEGVATAYAAFLNEDGDSFTEDKNRAKVLKLRRIIDEIEYYSLDTISPQGSQRGGLGSAGRDSLAFSSFGVGAEKIFLNVHYIFTSDGAKWWRASFGLRSANSILERLRDEKIFDEIFFARIDTGNVIQAPRNTRRILRLDTMESLDGRRISFRQFAQTDAVGLLNIAGENHRLFIHPLAPSRLDPTRRTFRNAETWAVCGLVKSAEFRKDSLSIPYNWMAFLSLLAILLVFCWPLLKLKFTHRDDRIKSLDVVVMTFSLIFGAAFAMIIFLELFGHLEWGRNLDQELREFGNTLGDRFESEINSAALALDAYTRPDTTTNSVRVKVLDNIGVKEWEIIRTTYPFFDQIFLVDGKSFQQIYKALVDSNATPRVQVGDRAYVTNPVRDRWWMLGNGMKFTMQPVFAKSTGRFSLTLALPHDSAQVFPLRCIDFRPLSLMKPILPDGFGFCIIDQDGKVLFHSKSDRNLEENFLEETNKPHLIREITRARSDEWISADYWGMEHRLYVAPLKSVPWSLITFYSMPNLRSLGVMTFSVSLLLFILYILPFALVFAFYFFLTGHRAGWMWPDPAAIDTYKRIGLYSAALLVLVIAALAFSRKPETILVMAAFLPHIGVVFAFLALNRGFDMPFVRSFLHLDIIRFKRLLVVIDVLALAGLILTANIKMANIVWAVMAVALSYIGGWIWILLPQEREQLPGVVVQKRTGDVRQIFVWVVFAVFLLGVVCPAGAFFVVAYETQMKLHLRSNQLRIAYDLDRREHAIKEEAGYVQLEGRHKEFEQLRFSEDKDKYFSFFFGTEERRGIAAAPSGEPVGWIDTLFIRGFMPGFNKLSYEAWAKTTDPRYDEYEWRYEPDICESYSTILRRSPLTSLRLRPEPYSLTSVAPTYVSSLVRPFRPARVLVFIGGLVALLAIFYQMLRFAIRELFLIELKFFDKPKKLSQHDVKTWADHWARFDVQEQAVIFRIAKDRFVDSENRRIVEKLLESGVLIRNPDFQLFDPEVVDPVLEAEKELEAAQAEKQDSRRKGTGALKAGFFAFVLLLVLFLFGTQRELWNSTLTFVTAAAALMPLLFRVLGVLGGDKSGK